MKYCDIWDWSTVQWSPVVLAFEDFRGLSGILIDQNFQLSSQQRSSLPDFQGVIKDLKIIVIGKRKQTVVTHIKVYILPKFAILLADKFSQVNTFKFLSG